jgi:hypothetical protein
MSNYEIRIIRDTYTGQISGESIMRWNGNGTISCIPPDPANTDYQKYLEWISAGNIAEKVELQG